MNCQTNYQLEENEKSELMNAVEQLKNGDEKGFSTLYLHTYKYVYSRARMLSDSEQEAMDILQEVYMAVYRNISTLKSNDSLYAWLKTITFHAGSKMLKKNRKESLLSEEHEEMLETLSDEDAMTEDTYVDRQDIETIRGCIKKLSNEHRTVIMAYYYDNLKLEEISELLSISVGTVKSRLHLARKKLKVYLEEQEKKQGYTFHSFGAVTLALALGSLLKQEMEVSQSQCTVVFRNICNELGIASSSHVAGITSVMEEGMKMAKGKSIFVRVAEMGMKKAVLSIAGVVGATTITATTVAVGVPLIKEEINKLENPIVESVIEQTVATITIEAGEEFNIEATDFLKADEKTLKDVIIDSSNVDSSKVGKYTVIASCEGVEYEVGILVEDTTKPEVTILKKMEETDDISKIDLLQLVEVKDASNYEVKFVGFAKIEDVNKDDKEVLETLINSLESAESLEGISTEVPVESGVYKAVVSVGDEYGNTSLNEVVIVLDSSDTEMDVDAPNNSNSTASKNEGSASENTTSNNTSTDSTGGNNTTVEQPKEEPKEDVEIEKPGLTPTQSAVVKAGYYNVIADPTGGYSVMVRGNEFSKGAQMIREYLGSMGYECRSCQGGWIDAEKDQFLVCVSSSNIYEKVDENNPDFWS